MNPRGRLALLVLALAVAVVRADDQAEDRERLAGLLRPQEPVTIQEAAIAALARTGSPSLPETLLDGWKGHSPRVRRVVLETLLRRESWTSGLLASLEDTCTPPEEIETSYRQRLLDHPNGKLRARAAAVYSSVSSPRETLVTTYRPALQVGGNAAVGALIFKERCAGCHRMAGVGSVVGPDLSLLKSWTPEALLVAIVDPNRSFEAGVVGYHVRTRDGRERTGLIVDETPNTLSIRSRGGHDEEVPRSTIETMVSTGRSLMPESGESDWQPNDLADLIAFLKK